MISIGKSMTFHQVVKGIPKGVYLKFQKAVILGCWDDGTPLTQQQFDICFSAIHSWQVQHNAAPSDPLEIALCDPVSLPAA